MPVRSASCVFVILAALAAHAHAAVAAEDGRVAQVLADARAYAHGEGVGRDPLRALELFCEAAREGSADAQYEMGWIYANGRGVVRNDRLAGAFFRLATDQGHLQARAMLSVVGNEDSTELPECMREQPALEYDDSPPLAYRPPEPLEDVFAPSTPEEAKVAKLVTQLAPEYEINPLLVLAVIRAESNFNAAARSPKNAQGLMQLIPETSARFNVKKPYDLVQNLRGGLSYLRWLLAYFEGNVPLVLAAYNAGEGTVERYRGIPPYAETRAYVQRIMRVFHKLTHPYDPGVVEPSPLMRRWSASAAR